MSRWVVDTSPLIFLAKLDRLDLLRQSADEILVPAAVVEEVQAYPDDASRKVEQALSSWLREVTVGERRIVDILLADLDFGEAEVIALASERAADRIVMDDLDGRRFARRQAGAGEDETEPEAEQRVRQVVVDGAGRGGLAGQGVAPLDGAELEELLEIVGEAARFLARLPGDLRDRGMAGGEGRQDRVVEGDLAQLFPQQEVGLAVERRVFVQQLGGDVGLDRAAVGESLQG